MDKGSWVKVYNVWYGRVLEVYTNRRGEEVVLVQCVKHAYKRQPPELVPVSNGEVEVVSREDVVEHAESYQRRVDALLKELFSGEAVNDSGRLL